MPFTRGGIGLTAAERAEIPNLGSKVQPHIQKKYDTWGKKWWPLFLDHARTAEWWDRGRDLSSLRVWVLETGEIRDDIFERFFKFVFEYKGMTADTMNNIFAWAQNDLNKQLANVGVGAKKGYIKDIATVSHYWGVMSGKKIDSVTAEFRDLQVHTEDNIEPGQHLEICKILLNGEVPGMGVLNHSQTRVEVRACLALLSRAPCLPCSLVART